MDDEETALARSSSLSRSSSLQDYQAAHQRPVSAGVRPRTLLSKVQHARVNEAPDDSDGDIDSDPCWVLEGWGEEPAVPERACVASKKVHPKWAQNQPCTLPGAGMPSWGPAPSGRRTLSAGPQRPGGGSPGRGWGAEAGGRRKAGPAEGNSRLGGVGRGRGVPPAMQRNTHSIKNLEVGDESDIEPGQLQEQIQQRRQQQRQQQELDVQEQKQQQQSAVSLAVEVKKPKEETERRKTEGQSHPPTPTPALPQPLPHMGPDGARGASGPTPLTHSRAVGLATNMFVSARAAEAARLALATEAAAGAAAAGALAEAGLTAARNKLAVDLELLMQRRAALQRQQGPPMGGPPPLPQPSSPARFCAPLGSGLLGDGLDFPVAGRGLQPGVTRAVQGPTAAGNLPQRWLEKGSPVPLRRHVGQGHLPPAGPPSFGGLNTPQEEGEPVRQATTFPDGVSRGPSTVLSKGLRLGPAPTLLPPRVESVPDHTGGALILPSRMSRGQGAGEVPAVSSNGDGTGGRDGNLSGQETRGRFASGATVRPSVIPGARRSVPTSATSRTSPEQGTPAAPPRLAAAVCSPPGSPSLPQAIHPAGTALPQISSTAELFSSWVSGAGKSCTAPLAASLDGGAASGSCAWSQVPGIRSRTSSETAEPELSKLKSISRALHGTGTAVLQARNEALVAEGLTGRTGQG